MTRKSGFVLFIYIILFIVLNIANSHMLLFANLNKYIIDFNFSTIGLFNSIIGDFVILAILLLIGLFIFKKRNSLMLYLLIVTFALNIFIFVMYIFTRFYTTLYVFGLDIFNNPGDGMVWPIIVNVCSELFFGLRIFYFIPAVLLLIIFVNIFKRMENEKIKIKIYTKISAVTANTLIGAMSFLITCGLISSHPESSLDIGLFAAKHGGIYAFYVEQVLGARFDFNEINVEDEETYENYIDIFNKNKESYVNPLDLKHYSNVDDLTGVLKGKNLYVIQLESYNNFFINKTINEIEVTPNLNKLVKENYYFSNVMTSVGIGNTSDAEFSVMTGLYSTGDGSMYWGYNDYKYDFNTLPKLFNQQNYKTTSYHGNVSIFYNRKIAHEQMLGFNMFKSKDEYSQLYPESENKSFYYNTWVNDEQMLKWGYEDALNEINKGNNFFSFEVLLQPHTPYSSSEITQYDWGKNINKSQLAYYLDNIKRNDEIIGNFIEKAKVDLPNTLFVLYGDHGCTIQDEEMRQYLNVSNSVSLRDKLNQIPVLFIDNSKEISKMITKENFDKVSSLVKSERDIFRTIINLFDLYDKCDELFGVNMFSSEPSIAYEAKNVDFKTDDFYANYRNTSILVEYNDIDDEKIKRAEDIIGKYRVMNNYYLKKKATK